MANGDSDLKIQKGTRTIYHPDGRVERQAVTKVEVNVLSGVSAALRGGGDVVGIGRAGGGKSGASMANRLLGSSSQSDHHAAPPALHDRLRNLSLQGSDFTRIGTSSRRQITSSDSVLNRTVTHRARITKTNHSGRHGVARTVRGLTGGSTSGIERTAREEPRGTSNLSRHEVAREEGTARGVTHTGSMSSRHGTTREGGTARGIAHTGSTSSRLGESFSPISRRQPAMGTIRELSNDEDITNGQSWNESRHSLAKESKSSTAKRSVGFSGS